MLKDGNFVPGIEGNDGLQNRRQVFGLTQHATPFIEAGILVPVEIIDQWIGRSPAGFWLVRSQPQSARAAHR